MWLLRSSKHYIINNQGRNQISEEDEASLERRRREPLGDSEGMPVRRGIAIIFFDSLAISQFRSLLYFKLQLSWRIKLWSKEWVYFFQFPFLSGYQRTFQPLKRISTVDLQNWTHQLTRNMLCFYSFYFIMQGKLIILRTRCFLHQNKIQFQWLKEKKLLQSKFC